MRLDALALQWFARRLARSQGFLDPVTLWSQLRRFGQPAEVLAPTELLRAGAVLHARGLINSQAIQHNLDWVWPHWVSRQFDPRDPAFVPRAFSLTHINLTHRNWTAVGLPDVEELPIVDPRGLVTPWYDGWSLDAWIVTERAGTLFPSRLLTVTQRLMMEEGVAVVTESRQHGLALRVTADVVWLDGMPTCRFRASGCADAAGWLVVALRPYNPEGISIIHRIEAAPQRDGWKVNGRQSIQFLERPDRMRFSQYLVGDVADGILQEGEESQVACPVGLATAAALFALTPERPDAGTPPVPVKSPPSWRHEMPGAIGVRPLRSALMAFATEVTVQVPLREAVPKRDASNGAEDAAPVSWDDALDGRCLLRVPDARWSVLYETAVRVLVLHSPVDVYPGPYTYKRFWFRDAAFIVHAMLCVGLMERAERVLDRFPGRQTPLGYFRSQDGEWDSNGQALWILGRFCAMSGRPPKPAWQASIAKAGRWIQRKRLSSKLTEPHAGLLPAGFSAEHLGPNDYYYWDDFWSVGGLGAAAELLMASGNAAEAEAFRREADDLLRCIHRSLEATSRRLGHQAVPASPYRRMDAGAIGSLAAGYPLQLWTPDDRRLTETVEFLLARCFLDGSFFQNISHSGLNAYLTLHVAQTLLRAGDPRHQALLQAVTDMASPTGQWPEAVHPKTGGGCMGDGQHVWAAAEWLLMVRNCFVREEGAEKLVVCAGISPAWCEQPGAYAFGPAPTSFGPVSVSIEVDASTVTVSWSGRWHGTAPAIDVRLPGYAPIIAPVDQSALLFQRPRPEAAAS